MSAVEWAEPPVTSRPGVRGTTRYAAIADELRANSPRWARVAEGVAPAVGTYLRKTHMPRPEFEVTCRALPDTGARKVDVYARYVGAS
jgi:hypothetical protein